MQTSEWIEDVRVPWKRDNQYAFRGNVAPADADYVTDLHLIVRKRDLVPNNGIVVPEAEPVKEARVADAIRRSASAFFTRALGGVAENVRDARPLHLVADAHGALCITTPVGHVFNANAVSWLWQATRTRHEALLTMEVDYNGHRVPMLIAARRETRVWALLPVLALQAVDMRPKPGALPITALRDGPGPREGVN